MSKKYQKIKRSRKNVVWGLLGLFIIVLLTCFFALPQYKKSTEKKHWQEIFQAERAVAQAQETYYKAHGRYAKNFKDLEISLPNLAVEGNKFKTPHFQGAVYGGSNGVFGEFVRLKKGRVAYSPSLITYYALPPSQRRQCRVKATDDNSVCIWLTGRHIPSKHGDENRYYF